MTGVTFFTPKPNETAADFWSNLRGTSILPGLGADFMITPNFGINAQILMINPEINLKFAF